MLGWTRKFRHKREGGMGQCATPRKYSGLGELARKTPCFAQSVDWWFLRSLLSELRDTDLGKRMNYPIDGPGIAEGITSSSTFNAMCHSWLGYVSGQFRVMCLDTTPSPSASSEAAGVEPLSQNAISKLVPSRFQPRLGPVTPYKPPRGINRPPPDARDVWGSPAHALERQNSHASSTVGSTPRRRNRRVAKVSGR
jgi:hypothetical protein